MMGAASMVAARAGVVRVAGDGLWVHVRHVIRSGGRWRDCMRQIRGRGWSRLRGRLDAIGLEGAFLLALLVMTPQVASRGRAKHAGVLTPPVEPESPPRPANGVAERPADWRPRPPGGVIRKWRIAGLRKSVLKSPTRSAEEAKDADRDRARSARRSPAPRGVHARDCSRRSQGSRLR